MSRVMTFFSFSGVFLWEFWNELPCDCKDSTLLAALPCLLSLLYLLQLSLLISLLLD